MFLLDTDVSVYFLVGEFGVERNIVAKHTEGLFLCWPGYFELVSIAKQSLLRYSGVRLQDVNTFIDQLVRDVLPMTWFEWQQYEEIVTTLANNGKLRQDRFGLFHPATGQELRQPGRMDIAIAATALRHNLTIATRNARDFQSIQVFFPALKLDTTWCAT